MRELKGWGATPGERVGNSVAHSIFMWIGRIYNSLIWLGGICIAVSMLLTVCDVFGRKFLSYPIPGTFEMVETILVFVAAVGMIAITKKGKNIEVDIISSHFPWRVKRALVSAGHFIGFVIFAATSWQLCLSAGDWMHRGILTGVLHFPFAPLKFMFAAGTGLLSLLLLGKFILSIAVRKQTRAFPDP